MTATYGQIEDEAHRRFDENPCTPFAHYIIEIVREGWIPVDPDLIAVRGVLADRAADHFAQQAYLNGAHDAKIHFQTALAAYKAGRAAR
jgi:hypothetical protein